MSVVVRPGSARSARPYVEWGCGDAIAHRAQSSLVMQELVEPRRLAGLVVAPREGLVRCGPRRHQAGSEFEVAVALVEMGA